MGDEPCECPGIIGTMCSDVGVASDSAISIVDGFSMTRDPYLTRGEVQVVQVRHCLRRKKVVNLMGNDLSANVDELHKRD